MCYSITTRSRHYHIIILICITAFQQEDDIIILYHYVLLYYNKKTILLYYYITTYYYMPKSSRSFSSRSLSPLQPSFFATSDSYSFMLSFSMHCMMSTCTNTQHSTHVGEPHFLKRLTLKTRPHFLKRLILKTRPHSLKRLIIQTNENTTTGVRKRVGVFSKDKIWIKQPFFAASSTDRLRLVGSGPFLVSLARCSGWQISALRPHLGMPAGLIRSCTPGLLGRSTELSSAYLQGRPFPHPSHSCPVWVQQWKIDSTFKDIPKDLDMQNYKCLNSKMRTSLNLEIRLPT